MASTLNEIISTAFAQAKENVEVALPNAKLAVSVSDNSAELIDELIDEALQTRLNSESAKVRRELKYPSIPEDSKTPPTVIQGRPRRNSQSNEVYMQAFMDRWKVNNTPLRTCTKLELITARETCLKKAHGLEQTARFYNDIINSLPEDDSTPGDVFTDEQIIEIRDQIWTAEEVPVE